ncbi:MAG: thiamine-phosphate kinase [Thermodesulfobacteriota bacterium]
MRLKDLGEGPLIKLLEERFAEPHPRIVKAIGDDAAVTLQSDGACLLSTTDIMVEDVHFSLAYTSPYLLGRKSVSISLSDIAAMGGRPCFLLVSLAMPPSTEGEFIDELYRGIKDSSEEFGVRLIGGNSSASSDGDGEGGGLVVGTTVLGEAERAAVLLRSGAQPGETVFVTGTLGDAALGLKALKENGQAALEGPLGRAAMKQLDPAPRVREGEELAKRGLASAMIDVSDGLVRDLKHICSESGVGAEVELGRLPLSDLMKGCLSENPELKHLPLSGGEDYELLFTAPEGKEREVSRLAEETGTLITPIGRVLPPEKGVTVIGEDGRPVSLASDGFEHFTR